MAISVRIRRALLLAAGTLLFPNVLTAQTTDRVRYYIAYDGSGSVAQTDGINHNQRHLLERLLELAGNKMESAAQFDLFVFGQTNAAPVSSIGYNPFVLHPQVKVDSIAASVGDQVRYNRKQYRTHLHTALDEILRQSSSGSNTAGGVFIFTDGLLAEGDVDTALLGSLESYKQRLRLSIAKLRLKNIPVFLIQTSQNTVSFLDSALQVPPGSTVAHGATFYWNSPEQDVRRDSSGFDAFLNMANRTIIAQAVQSADTITAAISASRLLRLQELWRKADITQEDRYLVGQNTLLPALDSLGALSQKSLLSTDEVRQVHRLLGRFQHDAGQARRLEQDFIQGLAAAHSYKPLQEADLRRLEETAVELQLYRSLDNSVPPVTMLAATETRAGNWQQALVLGLTDYVIDRAKYEAVFAFLYNAKKLLSRESVNTIRLYVLPNVYDVLEHPERYADLVQVKELFQRDMDALPENLLRYGKMIVRNEGLVALLSFAALYREFDHTGSLEQACRQLAGVLSQTSFDGLPDSRMRTGILFTARLIGFLEHHDLTIIRQDTAAMRLFSSLIATLAIDGNDISAIQIDSAVSVLLDVYEQYESLHRQIKILSGLLSHPPQADYEGYQKYQQDLGMDILKKTGTLLLSGDRILELIHFRGSDKPDPNIALITRKARQCVDAWFYLKEKKYAKAGILVAGGIADCTAIDGTAHEKLEGLIMVTAEVCDAQSGDEVKHVIAKYALPVASYRIKRNGYHALMISAYPGVSFMSYRGGGAHFGISAPIGLEYSIPLAEGLNVTLMASVVDIGNIVDYRLGIDSLKEDQISFQRIFSPGLIANIGLGRNVPLSLSGGYLFNPRRWTVGLSFDLPLFNLASRKGRRFP